MITQFSPN